MKTNKKNKSFNLNKFFIVLIVLILPFFVGLKVVELNNAELFSKSFLIIKDILMIALIVLFAINMFILIKNKKINVNKRKLAGFAMILLFVALELTSAIKLVYYNSDFKDWIIKTSVGSINYKYVATSIYSEDTINEVIDKESRNVDIKDEIIDYSDLTYSKVHYKNKFEEEILTHEEGALYKIIKIEGKTIGANYHYEGYMTIVYDPSRVTLGVSSGMGTSDKSYGETPEIISKRYKAKVAMNAGGFYDPGWRSNGGIPHGPTISNGKLLTEFARGIKSGGLIGFNKENKLVLKRMTGEEALKAGIRDAVDWGPYLIVNGKNYYKGVKHYSWACARAVIGQRADGIVLMLVIDGLQDHSKGASMADVAQIMENYGAINAANLDGGTSTMMTENHKYINKPWNGYVPTFRRIPNAWIVK